MKKNTTTAETLALIFVRKLQKIVQSSGFETSVGSRVFEGRRQIDDNNDIPCVVLVEGDDRPSNSVDVAGLDKSVLLKQHYVFEGFDYCEALHPNRVAHKIIRDLKRAIFTVEPGFDWRNEAVRSVKYAGRNIGVRADGTTIVSAYIEVDVEFLENLAGDN